MSNYSELDNQGNSFQVPMMEGFPMEETFEDFAGQDRIFTINCHQLGLGFALDAFEKNKDREGYAFSSYSETSYSAGLGDLRTKIRRMLATRHITQKDGRLNMLHDTICGRIDFDSIQGLMLYIDGQPVSISDLCGILETHEGFQFKLEIVDPSEDIFR